MSSIVFIPDSVLTTPARPVTFWDKKLALILSDMKKALLGARKPKGVGLAAPQIGVPYRIFMIKPDTHSEIRTFINPEITKKSSLPDVPKKSDKLEGCLSIPNIWGTVLRSPSLTLHYQDEAGGSHEEQFEGFPATIIQHETDHLDGVLFTKRTLEQKGKLYQGARDENGKEILEEMEIL